MHSSKRIPLLLALVGILVLPLSANAGRKKDRLKAKIQSLAALIENGAFQSTANKKSLKAAKGHLEEAILLLGGQAVVQPRPARNYDGSQVILDGPRAQPTVRDNRSQAPVQTQPPIDPYSQCVEFAFVGFEHTYSSASARDRAHKSCSGQVDLGIAQFLYHGYEQTYSSGSAMERALAGASLPNLFGKIDLLQFAYIGFEKSLSSGSAMDKSVEYVQTVRGSALRCLKSNYTAYERSMSSSSAMQRSFEVCGQRRRNRRY